MTQLINSDPHWDKNCPVKLEYSTVNRFYREKADRELNDTEEVRKKSLLKLKSLLQDVKDESYQNLSDELLLRCLRTKKFNCQKSFNQLKRYLTYRQKHPTLFQNRDRYHLRNILEDGQLNFLPYRSPSGCVVWVAKLDRWNPRKVTLDEMLKFGFFCLDKVSENEVTQICGVEIIIDFKGFGVGHLLHISPLTIKNLVTGVQDSYPLRHKALHIVNQPTVFDLLYAIVRPLLSKKNLGRVYFHGTDMKSLHRYIPVNILPEELGGSLGSFGNQKFYDSLFENEETANDNVYCMKARPAKLDSTSSR